MKLLTAMVLLLSGAALAGPAVAAEPPPGQLIKLWVRTTNEADRRVVTVDLATKPKTETAIRNDIQYSGVPAKYRGVPLRSLLDAMERTNRSDLVLLHFFNGMSVPLPIDDLELLKTLDPFVATEMQVNGAWLSAFLPVTKKDAEQRDVRPLKFQGNKLVVATRLHPFTSKASQDDGFSPFFFADTLTGIEFVRSENWYKQFDLGTTPAEKAGFATFKSHCQFCHAVRQVGGRYGIDFMQPTPVVKRLGVQALFLHVRYRDLNAAETGQMMPFFRDLTKDDVAEVFAWLQAVTAAPAVSYQAPEHHH